MQTRAQILSAGGGGTGWGIPLLYFSGWTCLEKSHGGQGLPEWDMPQPPKLAKIFNNNHYFIQCFFLIQDFSDFRRG